ncbi:hypothetical protein ACHAXM_004785 [Skeletonema potamos]
MILFSWLLVHLDSRYEMQTSKSINKAMHHHLSIMMLMMMMMMLSFLTVRATNRGFLGYAAAFQVIRNSSVSRSSFSPPQSLHHPSRCTQQHHMSASPIIPCNDSETNLVNMLKEAYEDRETDGVQDIIRANQIIDQLSANGDADAVADELVTAAVEASNSNKSLAAILNGILGSCCGSSSGLGGFPRVALAVLELIDEMHGEDESSMIKPDLVTLSLVYYSLCHQSLHQPAQLVLERAQQMSKKAAGSSRRKALAAERRKGSKNSVLDAKEAEKRLQALCGPDIHILYESSDLVVFSKPAGQVCYHNKKTSAGKISASRKKKKKGTASDDDDDDDGSKIDISLEDSVLDLNFALSTVNPVARGIIHRLDRGTSGCVCLAKSNEAHMKLIASFFLRRVTKKYLALVQLSSSSSLEQEGVMNALVDGKPAVSKYKVVNKYYAGDGTNQGVALLEVETLTGRKHQVRVHCSGIGHPIIFDPLYSSFEPPVPASRRKTKKDFQRKRGKGDNTEEHVLSLPKAITDLAMSMTPGQERFFLHAQTLSIPEFDVDVQAPLPTWWTETLDQLES